MKKFKEYYSEAKKDNFDHLFWQLSELIQRMEENLKQKIKSYKPNKRTVPDGRTVTQVNIDRVERKLKDLDAIYFKWKKNSKNRSKRDEVAIEKDIQLLLKNFDM
jgi:hypothetical protein